MVHVRPFFAMCGLLAFCFLFLPKADADASSHSGMFSADNSSYEYTFSETGPATFTAATTSYAMGGFVPVLTLFDATTGAEIDNDGTGFGDVSLSDVLGSGSYDLFLTEFPNVAVGDLSDGFLLDEYSDGATYTGDSCGVTGGMFYNTITCTPTTNQYALTASSTAVTPEPATWLLVLPPAAFLFLSTRRRNNA